MTDPAALEARGVALYQGVASSLRALDPQAAALLLFRPALPQIIGDQFVPGAVTPTAARGSLTRDALRRAHQRRRAVRAGPRALLRALSHG